MLLTTQDHFSDVKISKTLGLVSGNTVRTRHAGTHFLAGLKELIGGEITGYTQLLSEARQEALDRMIEAAKAQGADGVVAIRFSTSSIANGASEMLVVGTAVKL